MFDRILIPLDGSPLAERALASGLALGRQVRGEATLLRVLVPEHLLALSAAGYGLLWPDEPIDRARQAAAEYLDILENAYTQSDLTLRTTIASGDVAGTIIDTAAQTRATLIVMSTHGYSGLTRWVMGSVAEKVLHGAACPVLVLRSTKPIQHILIPLDGSKLSESALEPGLELAAGLGAEVTLLRAVDYLDATQREHLNQMERGLAERVQLDARWDAVAYLNGLARRHAQAGLTLHTQVVDGPAARGILEFAESQPVDVIAMATHGRTGLRRWTYGSVTEKVLRSGIGSMLVVRPDAHALGNLEHQPRFAGVSNAVDLIK